MSISKATKLQTHVGVANWIDVFLGCFLRWFVLSYDVFVMFFFFGVVLLIFKDALEAKTRTLRTKPRWRCAACCCKARLGTSPICRRSLQRTRCWAPCGGTRSTNSSRATAAVRCARSTWSSQNSAPHCSETLPSTHGARRGEGGSSPGEARLLQGALRLAAAAVPRLAGTVPLSGRTRRSGRAHMVASQFHSNHFSHGLLLYVVILCLDGNFIYTFVASSCLTVVNSAVWHRPRTFFQTKKRPNSTDLFHHFHLEANIFPTIFFCFLFWLRLNWRPVQNCKAWDEWPFRLISSSDVLIERCHRCSENLLKLNFRIERTTVSSMGLCFCFEVVS